MTQHTPGPWDYDGSEEITYDQGFRALADIRDHNGFESIDPPTVFANGRLIAAAPELLKALAGIIDLVPPDCQAEAHTAIAKALDTEHAAE